MIEIKDDKLTHNEAYDMISSMALDLISAFSIAQDRIYDLLTRAEKENWTPDDFVREVENII